MAIKKSILLLVLLGVSFFVSAQVKRENLAQTTIGPAEFVLERVITLKSNDTVVSINVTFFDMAKSAKKRVFIGIAIEKSKSTYHKMISNFKEAVAFQSTEYLKTWESESYQLESARKELFKFSQPDKNTQSGHAYTQFTKEQMLSIIVWLESLKW
jgi:hypothetical protein